MGEERAEPDQCSSQHLVAAVGEGGVAAPSSCLLLLVLGLPGAGKSTLCRQLLSAFCEDHITAHATCFDDEEDRLLKERAEDGGDGCTAAKTHQVSDSVSFDPEAWKRARRKVLQEVTAAVTSATGNAVFILDDNFYLRSMRKPYFQLARRVGCNFIQLMVKSDAYVERNAARWGRAHVPAFVLNHMTEVFEAPWGCCQPESPAACETVASARKAPSTWERLACCLLIESQGTEACEDLYSFRGADRVSSRDLVRSLREMSAVPRPVAEEEQSSRQPDGQGADARPKMMQELEIHCRRVINGALRAVPPGGGGAGAKGERKQLLAKRLGQMKKTFIASACQQGRSHVPRSEDDEDIEGAVCPSLEELSVVFLKLCRDVSQDAGCGEGPACEGQGA